MIICEHVINNKQKSSFFERGCLCIRVVRDSIINPEILKRYGADTKSQNPPARCEDNPFKKD